MPYLKKAGGAFSTIIKAPGRFISTLVAAGKQGFNQFRPTSSTHLRDALFKWLLGSAEGAGIYFPKSFAPLELLKFGLSVLGLTWANIRGKLVAATNETVVKALETGFDIVMTLVTEGPAAAWEDLLKTLSNLQDDGRRRRDRLRQGRGRQDRDREAAVVPDPGGRVHPGDHRDLPHDHVLRREADRDRPAGRGASSTASRRSPTASSPPPRTRSRRVLATGLSLAISFLANFAGLGNIPKKVMEIIKKIRAAGRQGARQRGRVDRCAGEEAREDADRRG